MKIKKSIYALLVVLMVTTACSGPRTVTLRSMRPAQLPLPETTKTILLLDRTAAQSTEGNFIEGILSGEMPGEDQSGAQQLIVGLFRQLDQSGKYSVVFADERLEGNSIHSVFPDRLSPELLERLAVKYQVDAVIALELFDSDFVVTRGRKENGSSKLPDLPKFYAQGIGNITAGIRLYDLHQNTVLDQQLLTKGSNWETTALSVPEAIAQLTSKGEATRDLSYQVGKEYAYKICPMPITITRSFRGKAKRVPELELGTRYADVGQWERALETWKSALDQARQKEAGYLAHNIAVAYEVMGDFNSAIYWAKLAYTRYGNQDSRSYVNQIRQRQTSEGLAEMQR